MAFCPNCGKSVGEQAAKCSSCGKDLGQQAPKARFKGTMLMTPAAVPAGVQLPPKSPGTPLSPPSGPAVQSPSGAVAAAMQPTANPAARTRKGTMLGTGNGALSAPPGPHTSAPPPAGSIRPTATAAADAQQAPPASMDSLADTAPHPVGGGESEDDSQRFLVGDPMAPHTPAEGSPRRQHLVPAESSNSSVGLLLTVALIGIAAIAAVGYFAAKKMGLIN